MSDTKITAQPDNRNILRPASTLVFCPAKVGSLSLDSVIIGIVTILPEEYAAVCEILGCHQEEYASGGSGTRKYKLGVVWQPSGKSGINVAVAQLLIAGTTDSAVIANNFLYDCPNIREIIVCGIAGAVPNPANAEDHVRFGDIVVSGMEGVLPYDFGKETPSGFDVRGAPYRPSSSLIQSARGLQSDEERGLRPWETYIDNGTKALGEDYQRPPADTDVLCEQRWGDFWRLASNLSGFIKEYRGQRATYPPIPHPDDPVRVKNPGRPRVFHGLIASANKVLGDRRTRERLRRVYKAKAVEMEAAGAAHAAYRGSVGYFVVRGTCDYCNEHKNNLWHRYAALVAAAFTRALIEATNPRVFEGPPKVLAIAVPVTPDYGAQSAIEGFVPHGYAQQVIKEPDMVEAKGEKFASETGLANPPLTSGNTREIPSLTDAGTYATLQLPVITISAAGHGVMAPTPTPGGLTGTETEPPSFATEPRVIPAEPEQTYAPATDEATAKRYVDVSPLERQLLTSEGERRLREIKKLVDVWEFEPAIAMADTLAEWVQAYEEQLPQDLNFQCYTQLARVEGIRARRRKDMGEEHDSTRARFFLEKAKHAAN